MKPFTTSDFQQAKAKHLQFKSRLRAILYGELPEHESAVLSQYACAVGKWIYGHALIAYEHIPEVHELEQIHASIHVVARELVRQFYEGKVDEARQGLVGMEQIADRLVELLHIVEEKVTDLERNALDILTETNPNEASIMAELLTKNELLDAKIKQQVEAENKALTSIKNERQVLHNFFMQAPAAHCILRGPTHIFELTNPPYQELIGGREVLGKTVREGLPELEGQGFYELLDSVFSTGEAFIGNELPIFLDNGKGTTKNAYLNFIYQPIKNELGQPDGILVFAYEVTEQVLARKIIEESEDRFRSLINESPVATCLLVGRDMQIELANEIMLTYWGRDKSAIGKSHAEALPELDGQPFGQLLDTVFTTGKTYSEKAALTQLLIKGTLGTYYFDFTYKPLVNSAGNVYAILGTAIDVTEEVKNRQKLVDTEEALRGAIDLAELGTWSIDLTTGLLDYSERLRGWFGIGLDEIITIERAYQPIREADRPLVKAAITHAITPGTNGIYDVEYTVNASPTVLARVLHAQGKAFYNAQGQAHKISGTVQDITEQRAIQVALEQQVQVRTEELGAVNEELAASNEELTESNELLIRSNENLQKFAYVASHDLQEPLRKIQQFGDLLKTRYAAPTDEASLYLDRMHTAASRMSSLIRDLLTFSRISTQHDDKKPVSLTEVAQMVQTDLELVIEETQAVVTIDPLPLVMGDATQLGQLFLNLLSNALKYRRAGIPPLIRISSQTVLSTEFPPSMRPMRTNSAYHRIEVADNGIGFDEKYLDRIFQVFQRLHGKNEFVGTGIGLAICEKVVVNHGGAITAISQVGKGTTFQIYLPIIENL